RASTRINVVNTCVVALLTNSIVQLSRTSRRRQSARTCCHIPDCFRFDEVFAANAPTALMPSSGEIFAAVLLSLSPGSTLLPNTDISANSSAINMKLHRKLKWAITRVARNGPRINVPNDCEPRYQPAFDDPRYFRCCRNELFIDTVRNAIAKLI